MLAYVLQVKVEMELEIQQCEKTKAVREEQLERLTQICQEQAVSTKKIQPASQVNKYLYNDKMFVIWPLYIITMDLWGSKWNVNF